MEEADEEKDLEWARLDDVEGEPAVLVNVTNWAFGEAVEPAFPRELVEENERDSQSLERTREVREGRQRAVWKESVVRTLMRLLEGPYRCQLRNCVERWDAPCSRVQQAEQESLAALAALGIEFVDWAMEAVSPAEVVGCSDCDHLQHQSVE